MTSMKCYKMMYAMISEMRCIKYSVKIQGMFEVGTKPW